MDNEGKEHEIQTGMGTAQIATGIVARRHRLRQQSRRRNEDVDYWKQRAGWFDDDQAMQDYNNGVNDANVQLDDNDDKEKGSRGGGQLSSTYLDVTTVVIRSLVILILLGICILLYRAIVSRPFSGSTQESEQNRQLSSRERSESRERSRKGGKYKLLSEDGKGSRRKRSRRGRSRTRRSRDDEGNGKRKRSGSSEQSGSRSKSQKGSDYDAASTDEDAQSSRTRSRSRSTSRESSSSDAE
jgi:hypothetical protein